MSRTFHKPLQFIKNNLRSILDAIKDCSLDDLIDVLNNEDNLDSSAISNVLDANGQYVKIANRHYWKVNNKLYPLSGNLPYDAMNKVKGNHLQLHERLELKNYHPKLPQLELLHHHLSDFVINFKVNNRAEETKPDEKSVEEKIKFDDEKINNIGNIMTKNEPSAIYNADKNTTLEKQNYVHSLQKHEIHLYKKLNEVLTESLLKNVQDFTKPISFLFPLENNFPDNKDFKGPIQLQIVLTPKARESYHKSSSERTKLYQHLKAWDNSTKNLWYLKKNSASAKQHLQTKSECEFLNTAFFPAFKCKKTFVHSSNNQHNFNQNREGNNLQLNMLNNNFGYSNFNDYPNTPNFVGGDNIRKTRIFGFELGGYQTYNSERYDGSQTVGAGLTRKHLQEITKRKTFLPSIHNKYRRLDPHRRHIWTSPVDEYYRLKLCKLADMISNRRREKQIKYFK